MGGTWVEKNVGYILGRILELLSNSKATSNHVDAVYSRKCVSFILRSMLGRLLGEKAQVIAGKELCKLISKQMTKVKVLYYFSQPFTIRFLATTKSNMTHGLQWLCGSHLLVSKYEAQCRCL